MGTSSSYTGSGGKPGRDLRNELEAWLDEVEESPPADGNAKPELPPLPVSALVPALFVPAVGRRSSGGGGGDGTVSGGGGGGASGRGTKGGGGRSSTRTIRGYASAAGQAAAAARAFREGDRGALAELGLDFDRLSAMPNRFEMVRDIVDVVCAAQSESSIGAEEQREIAAHVADWVLDPTINADTPGVEDVAREAIALITAQVYLTEANAQVDRHGSTVERSDFEARVIESATALAATAEISVQSSAAKDISKAIRKTISTLRKVHPLNKKKSN